MFHFCSVDIENLGSSIAKLVLSRYSHAMIGRSENILKNLYKFLGAFQTVLKKVCDTVYSINSVPGCRGVFLSQAEGYCDHPGRSLFPQGAYSLVANTLGVEKDVYFHVQLLEDSI